MLTAKTDVLPPAPIIPTPRLLSASYSSSSSLVIIGSGCFEPIVLRHAACLARLAATLAVPPMPTPKMEGGQIAPVLVESIKLSTTNFLMPVSYTHLDVYKRQVLYSTVLFITLITEAFCNKRYILFSNINSTFHLNFTIT